MSSYKELLKKSKQEDRCVPSVNIEMICEGRVYVICKGKRSQDIAVIKVTEKLMRTWRDSVRTLLDEWFPGFKQSLLAITLKP